MNESDVKRLTIKETIQRLREVNCPPQLSAVNLPAGGRMACLAL